MVKIEDYAAAREIISSEIDAFNEKNEKFEATWSYQENKQGGYFIIAVTYDNFYLSHLSLREHLVMRMDDSAIYDRTVLKKDLKDSKEQLMYRVNITQAYKALGLYVPEELRD